MCTELIRMSYTENRMPPDIFLEYFFMLKHMQTLMDDDGHSFRFDA